MMNKITSVWRVRMFKENMLTLAGYILSAVIAVLALLQMGGIWKNAINVFEPLLGVLMIINGLKIYKESKRVAWSHFGCAAFIFFIAILILFM